MSKSLLMGGVFLDEFDKLDKTIYALTDYLDTFSSELKEKYETYKETQNFSDFFALVLTVDSYLEGLKNYVRKI